MLSVIDTPEVGEHEEHDLQEAKALLEELR